MVGSNGIDKLCHKAYNHCNFTSINNVFTLFSGNPTRMSSTYAESELSLPKAAWELSESLADILPCISVSIIP